MHHTLVGIGVLLVVLAAAVAAPSGQTQARPAPKAEVSSPIDINAATAAQLESLPGVGPKTAARIVEYRDKNGSFKKIEELMNVQGIGEKNFLRIKDLITVTPAKAREAAAQPKR